LAGQDALDRIKVHLDIWIGFVPASHTIRQNAIAGSDYIFAPLHSKKLGDRKQYQNNV
jgi:hypothetical protein